MAHSAVLIGDGERAAVDRVLTSGRLVEGPEIEAFECECAAKLGRGYGVAVSSGTAGLHLAILALNLPPTATIAFPAYACAALRTAVDAAGLSSALCDVDENFNALVSPGADGAIVPHLFGCPAQLPTAMPVIEDIAQSIGAEFGGGTIAALASFYATKLMTTGEGGMVLTDDEGFAEAVRDRRDYDKREVYGSRFNYKMTEMQAAMGRVQLKRLSGFIARRREIAGEYDRAFADYPLVLPRGTGHVYSRYVVSTDRRDSLESHLNDEGIEAKRPVYRPAHFDTPEAGSFPGADAAHGRALSLPVHPAMNDDQVTRVIECVKRFFD